MGNTSQDTNSQLDGSRYNSKVWYSAGTIRAITLGVSDMFNDIKVRRFANDFITVVKEIDVPLHIAPKTKEYYERKEDYSSSGGQRYYQQVPAMALLFTGLSYAPSRVSSPNEQRSWPYPVSADVDPDYFNDYQPSPWDFQFELRIRSESMEDYVQIVEQIHPFFNSALTIRMREIPFLNVARNLRVNLDGNNLDIPTEMSGTDMNQIDGVVNFTVEGYLYRPVTSAVFLRELYKYLSDTQGGSTFDELDRRIRTLMAITEGEIPAEAVNKRKTLSGYWLYEIVDKQDP